MSWVLSVMSIFERIINKIIGIYSFKKTIAKFYKIKKIEEIEFKGLIFRGADINDLSEIKQIYIGLSGNEFSGSNINLLKYCARKLVIIAEKKVNGSKRILGMDLYYMNPRDFQESTVHEGFIGVLPEYEGQGIATQMRKHAIAHFKKAGFKGISTRISKSNIGSLRSAEKLGFKPVEEYFDTLKNEDRYYMVCKLGEVSGD